MENGKYSREKVDIFWKEFLIKTGTIIPFSDITYDICKREGEDDTLESWRAGHINFFKEEGKKLGYEFKNDMPVIFEDFEVVYQA